jgi:hypothetical protein
VAVARKLSPEEERELLLTQSALTALTQHPSWHDLVKAMEEKRSWIERTILRRVLVDKKPVDPVEMSYWHGFVEGIEYFVRVPANAENRLEHILRRQAVGNGRSSE